MPDYSLQRNTPPTSRPPAPQQQHQPHGQTQAPPPTQTQSPMTQLAQASDNAKKDTENALLREALATSAQNSEALIGQLVKSQAEFTRSTQSQINEILRQFNKLEQNMKNCVELLDEQTESHLLNQQKMLENYNTNHQSQLHLLKNQNDMFSKCLNDVLEAIADRLVAQVKADTVTAMQENMDSMNGTVREYLRIMGDAVESHVTEISTAYTNMTKANTRVENYDKKLKTMLDNRLKAYRESVNRLYQIDGAKKFFFWVGIMSSILTPLVLIVSRFF